MKTSELNKKLAGFDKQPSNLSWNVEKGWESYLYKKSRTQVYRVLAIASSLLILMAMTFLLRIDQTKQFGNLGENNIQLDINKEVNVILNNNSEITYNAKQRLIRITGESFFEIDAKQNYTICMGEDSLLLRKGVVNIKYDKKTNRCWLYVESGDGIYRTKNNELKLFKGECLINEMGMAVFVEPILNENYKAWITKRFVFEELPLFMALEQINKVFPFAYQYVDKATKYCEIDGSFSGESMLEILNKIPFEKHLEFRIDNNQLIIAGPGC